MLEQKVVEQQAQAGARKDDDDDLTGTEAPKPEDVQVLVRLWQITC